MDVKSPTSSYACYEDGVLDKIETTQFDTSNDDDEHASNRDEQLPSPKIPKAALGCLVLLFVFSFVTIITSGIVFSHGVASSNCLAQSWVMFSAIMGFLYICLHLQAARRGDPVNRTRPSFQHPLHSSAIVVARIDMISWIISLMVVSVAVSKTAIAASSTTRSNSTIKTTNTAGAVLSGPRPPPASVKEARPWSFTKFDDRTKRQLAASVSEASHSSETRPRVGGPRPLAASDIATRTGILPPPVCTEPPRTVEPRRIEPPPPPPLQQQQQHQRGSGENSSRELVVRSGSGAGTGGAQHSSSGASGVVAGAGADSNWKGEWSDLRNITGWYTPASSSATTPASTPALDYGAPPPPHPSSRSRPLSTVAEADHPTGRREIAYDFPHPSAGAAPLSAPAPAPASISPFSTPIELEGSGAMVRAAPAARRSRTMSHAPEPPPYTAAAPTTRPRCLTGPRGPEPQYQVGGYPCYGGASMPRAPPPAASAGAGAVAGAVASSNPMRAPTTARVRLQRAQDALKTQGRTMPGTMVLNRPQRLTGDRRGSVDDRLALRAPPRGGSGEGLRMPGSYVE